MNAICNGTKYNECFKNKGNFLSFWVLLFIINFCSSFYLFCSQISCTSFKFRVWDFVIRDFVIGDFEATDLTHNDFENLADLKISNPLFRVLCSVISYRYTRFRVGTRFHAGVWNFIIEIFEIWSKIHNLSMYSKSDRNYISRLKIFN